MNFSCYTLPFTHKTWIVLKSQIATEHWVLCIYMTGILLCFRIEVFDISCIKYISTVAMFLLPKCSFRTVKKCRKPPASLQKPCLYLFIPRQKKQKVFQTLTDADTGFATQIRNGGLLSCSWQWSVPPVQKKGKRRQKEMTVAFGRYILPLIFQYFLLSQQTAWLIEAELWLLYPDDSGRLIYEG